MTRSLRHYWRQHLVVALGTAVATSVLTGALLVGDSVRGSLRALTVERLGIVTHAVRSAQYFRAQLAENLAAETEAVVVPVIELTATLENLSTGARARSVTVFAVDERFNSLFPKSELSFEPETRRPRTILLNQPARLAVSVSAGDRVQMSFARPSNAHRETLFGREEATSSVEVLRLRVGKAPKPDGGNRFSLEPNQALPLVGYVSLPGLQRVLNVGDRVNRLLVAHPEADASSEAVFADLSRGLELVDFGLRIVGRKGGLALESDGFLIGEEGVKAAKHVGRAMGVPVLGILTYLANEMTVGSASIPYSTVSAVGLIEGEANHRLGVTGLRIPVEDEIVLNTWAADRLLSRPGDELRLTYYHFSPKEDLDERTETLHVAGRVEMAGLASDPALTPDFPGLHDADDMAAWNAPFPVDLTRIEFEDEAYWDAHAATPKAFVSLPKGRALWESPFGILSGVRLLGTDERVRHEFEQEMLAALPSGSSGLQVVTSLADGLAASSGATDFSGLFIGFSLFLIVSSILLVSLLYGLSLERRRSEAGLLLATGFVSSSVRRRWTVEAGVVALVGCAAGLPGAALYCSALMDSLSSAWVAAVGTRLLTPHYTLSSFVVGLAVSAVVIVATILLTVKRVLRVPVRMLLAGASINPPETPSLLWRRWGQVGLFVAGLCLAGGVGSDAATRTILFFAVGASLLMAGIAFLAGRLSSTSTPWASSHLGLGVSNASRNRGRSLLSVTLVACASFVIVAVGANRHDALSFDHPGTGGFELVAESDSPILLDLERRSTRIDLGFSEGEVAAFEGTEVLAFRVKPGEDVSCLNLYQPRFPKILGVSRRMAERGGFNFQAVDSPQLTSLRGVDGEPAESPWSVLYREFGDGAIPAIADYASATWILHLGLGDDVVVLDDRNEPVRLRIVGLLQNSLLQGELMIAEDRFLEVFPSQEGYQFFLIDTPAERVGDVALSLERRLGRFGFDTVTSVQRLASYKAVENTYMSTFQVLGGLGLCLGTVGLAIVMMKNAIDRRREFAVMRAVGYRRNALGRMVLAEGLFLLLSGVCIGALAGTISVAPHLVETATRVPFVSLGSTLGLIVAVGVFACWVTTRVALSVDVIPMLKAET